MSEPRFNSPKRWAARLAFPLAAAAVVLGMQAMREAESTPWWIGAAACALAGIVCLRLSRR